MVKNQESREEKKEGRKIRQIKGRGENTLLYSTLLAWIHLHKMVEIISYGFSPLVSLIKYEFFSLGSKMDGLTGKPWVPVSPISPIFPYKHKDVIEFCKRIINISKSFRFLQKILKVPLGRPVLVDLDYLGRPVNKIITKERVFYIYIYIYARKIHFSSFFPFGHLRGTSPMFLSPKNIGEKIRSTIKGEGGGGKRTRGGILQVDQSLKDKFSILQKILCAKKKKKKP